MACYEIDVSLTVCVSVDAESEEQAKEKAVKEWLINYENGEYDSIDDVENYITAY